MGIFDSEAAGLFTTYTGRLKFRGKVAGGTPKDPRVIEGWLRSKAGIESEQEILQATMRTLRELGADIKDGASFEDMTKASEALAANRNTVGFKFAPESGLYIESRIIKAMLKEAVAIVFPWQGGNKWGPTKKSARSLTAEYVFVDPDVIPLGRTEPDAIDLFIGHVSGPQGPRSTLGYHEVCEQATIEFTVRILNDEIKADQWAKLWVYAQENGLGSLRSQGYGRFDLEAWDMVKS